MGEFEPEPGRCSVWIPWHVQRSFNENLTAVRAALAGHKIQLAAIVLSPRVPLAKMRIAAYLVAGSPVVVYDEDLRVVKGAGWGRILMERARANAASPRTRQWLRRVTHPAEAEIPVRARAAQLYGIAAAPLRATRRERSIEVKHALAAGVSVVIPSRDGRELLANMLPALMPQIGSGEIIVSDNGSTDGTAEWLAEHYPAVRVIRTASAALVRARREPRNTGRTVHPYTPAE